MCVYNTITMITGTWRLSVAYFAVTRSTRNGTSRRCPATDTSGFVFNTDRPGTQIEGIPSSKLKFSLPPCALSMTRGGFSSAVQCTGFGVSQSDAHGWSNLNLSTNDYCLDHVIYDLPSPGNFRNRYVKYYDDYIWCSLY